MPQFALLKLFICILFHISYLIQLSSEHYKYSRESESYDEETSDKTIDVSDRDDSDEKTVSMSYEADDIDEKRGVGR